MSKPIRIVRHASQQGSAVPAQVAQDQLQRPLRDLRISITDKCNFRCTYCMPREVFGPDYPFLSHGELLSFRSEERRVGKESKCRRGTGHHSKVTSTN